MRGKQEKQSKQSGGAASRTRKTPDADGTPPEGMHGDASSKPSARKKRVTIADIARLANVSPTTVSITLADRRDISIPDVTRDRVKRCADELGYFPSRLGKGFFRGNSKLVGSLILSDSYHPFVECLGGIHKGLAAADYVSLSLSSDWLHGHTDYDDDAGIGCSDELLDLRRLLEYQVEGVIYFSMNEEHAAACIGELVRRGIPTVALGGVDISSNDIDVVGADNEAVGRVAAEHLLSVGCTSFALGEPRLPFHVENIVSASFAARIRKAGYPCDSFSVDEERLGDLGGQLSRLVRPPVGFFSTRSTIAALALRAAFSLGWRTPRDFSVAGMGKSELYQFNALPITTVNRNSFEAGETAAKLLIRRIEGFAGRPQRVMIPPTLEIRQSSVSDISWILRSEDSP